MITSPVLESQSSAAGATDRAAQRMMSLDVFRGLIVAGMLVVTNAGSWDHVYWPLKHAEWNGVTPTDMIFPSFLFIAGISLTFSLASRRRRRATTKGLAKHILTRSFCLIALGLALNGFPLYDLQNIRIPGILQRIGLCYAVSGLFYLGLTRRRDRGIGNAGAVAGMMVALMAVYWALMTLVPVPGYGAGRLDSVGSLEAYIDRAVFGTRHLWVYGGQTWDPEGLLSTMTATCNVLLGILAGAWLQSERSQKKKLLSMAAVGLLFLIGGAGLNPLLPINKKIWTPSFVLFSGGFSFVFLAGLSAVIDRWRWRRGLTPWLVFGTNAILAFALATMLNSVEPLIQFQSNGHPQSIRGAIYGAFARFLSPCDASLAYALLFVAANCAIVYLFYRKRMFLRL